MSWAVVVIISIAVVALVAFLIRRNMKDEKKFEQKLNAGEFLPEEHKRRSEKQID